MASIADGNGSDGAAGADKPNTMRRKVRGLVYRSVYLDFLDSDLSSHAIRLLLWLDGYADNRGESWPSVATLAEKMRMSIHTVYRCIRELEEAGAIRTEHEPTNRPGPPRATYRLWPEYDLTDRATEDEQHRTGADTLSGNTLTHENQDFHPRESRFAPLQKSNQEAIYCEREPLKEANARTRERAPGRRRTGAAPRETLGAFDACWTHYPRKLNRQGALKAFRATIERERAAGRTADAIVHDLKWATHHYAEWHRARGTEPEFILHGATFYGPNERWREWVAGAPEEPSTNGHRANGSGDAQAAARARLAEQISERMGTEE